MTEGIDINEVVRKATGLVANLVKKSTNRFEVDLATDLPLLRGNAQRIEQVVINLLVNSCQALPDKERLIALRTRLDRPSGGLTIAVADEGTGMSSEVLQRIKDPFYTTKRESGGTGLGLAIAERIVEDHGGRIQFVSQPGRGTTAEVWIPIPQTTGEPMG